MTTEQIAGDSASLTKSDGFSLVQFYRDMVGVMLRPKLQLAAIKERLEIWESFVLLFVAFYVSFYYVGGIYFPHDPLPLYSIWFPALFGAAALLLDVATIHWAARALKGGGTFRGLLSLHGFSFIPKFLLAVPALIVLLVFPSGVLGWVAENHLLALGIVLAVAIPLLIWNLILKILVIRVAYGIGVGKSIVAIILSALLFGVLWVLPFLMLVGSAHISFRDLQAYLAPRYDIPNVPGHLDISIPVDRTAFKLRQPRRFELVSVSTKTEAGAKTKRRHFKLFGGADFRNQELVRIVGLPGDRVEVRSGQVWLNGAPAKEEYLVASNPDLNLAPVQVTSGSVYLLPDNRKADLALVPSGVIPLSSISGRLVVSKYPFGWICWKPEVFKHGTLSPP
ncbi:MAG TPA: S26 family signal peptidase [Acidobacteriota bacterium]|jgi:hypothetical protein